MPSSNRPDLLGPGAHCVLGLMTGTSTDSVDAALVRISGAERPESVRAEPLRFVSVPYPAELRDRVFRAYAEPCTVRELCLLHAGLGELLADAAEACVEGVGPDDAPVAAGSHGQTLWHEPPQPGCFPTRGTLQAGEAARIAHRLGIPVVSDFRQQDLAAGGQGAPLVPVVDFMLFRSDSERRALQNIGGIGNVTYLARSGTLEELVAFDTGPGNCLMDAATVRLSAGELPCDLDGKWASAATPDLELVERLLADPYFDLPPPRSTGREHFSADWMEPVFEVGLPPEAILSTLTEVTVQSISRSYRRWLPPVDRIILSGGGARNPELVRRLQRAVAPCPVDTTATWGIEDAAKEAIAFAILAYMALRGWDASFPGTTGTARPSPAGKICFP